jgi:ATP-dependent RNA helicase DDX3X
VLLVIFNFFKIFNHLVFLETKKGVDQLNYFLNKANYNTIAIHGDKTQIKRLEAIKQFTNGEIPILIATDVASRGLDFPNVSYVFNYDMPNNIDDYIHRIGRTGRCGNKGTSISFISEKSKPIIKDLHKLLVKLKKDIPDWLENLYMKHKDERTNGKNNLNKI